MESEDSPTSGEGSGPHNREAPTLVPHQAVALADGRGSPLRLALRLFVVPYLLLSFLFYGLVQLQHAVLGTVVVLHEHIRMLGLLTIVAVSLIYVLRRSSIKLTNVRLVAFVAMYGCYVIADFVLKLVEGRVNAAALIYGETYFYFYVFFSLLLLVLSSNALGGEKVLVEKGAFRALYVLVVPVFSIGFAQFVLNKPLLFVNDQSGYAIQVNVNSDLKHERAFSVFASGFEYGHFITLMAALATAFLVDRKGAKGRGVFWVLLVSSVFAAFSTYTRNTYIEYLLTILAVLFVRRFVRAGWPNPRIVLASIGTGIATYVAVLAFFLTATGFAKGVLDVRTFGIRLLGVASVVRRYFLSGGSTSSVLLGYGHMQGPKFAALAGIRPLTFDNTYVDVALFSGLVGLTFYLVFFFSLFGYAVAKYRQTRAYWWLGLSAMYFSYPVVATSNIHVSDLFLITCLVIAYDILAQRRLLGSQGQMAQSTKEGRFDGTALPAAVWR